MTSIPPPVWNPPNTLEEFKEQFETDSSQLFNQLIAIFRRLRTERDTARSQLVLANQSIDTLEEQTTKLNVDLNIARAGHTSAAATSTIDTEKAICNFRSEKFPDPEKYNGVRSKLPGFLTQLKMKLEINSDRFRNESAKVIYSVSRLEGKALDQVVPLVTSNPTAPFSSVNAFFSYLESSFGDPDPRGTARRELTKLKQGKGDFASYYSQFLRIMAYLDYNECAKIDALTEGLSEELKDALTYRTDPQKTLEAYAATLMKIDNQVRGRKAEKEIRNNIGQFSTTMAPHPSHVPGGLAPMNLSATQISTMSRPAPENRYEFINGQRKISANERQWRRNNNLCIYCAGSGHVLSNCPSATRSKGNQPTINAAVLTSTLEDTAVSHDVKISNNEKGFQMSQV